MAYWIFQGNPTYYDFKVAINDNVLDNWGVKRYKNEIKKGDKIIIWLSTSNGGLAGLAEVTELNVTPRDSYCFTEKGKKFNSDKKDANEYCVGINILTDPTFFVNPITLPGNIKNILPVGRPGDINTNIKAEEYQYNLIADLLKLPFEVLERQLINEVPEFSEGKIYERVHKLRERNSEVIRVAKENFKKKHGKLFCEVCGFDFEERYGEIGKDFIEGHHILPVHKMMDNHRTRPEDIAMLCANCHRMIHKEWMAIGELKLRVRKSK